MRANGHLPEYERGFLAAFEAIDEVLMSYRNMILHDNGTLPDVAQVTFGGVQYAINTLRDDIGREFEREVKR